jgi:hypothetical protein
MSVSANARRVHKQCVTAFSSVESVLPATGTFGILTLVICLQHRPAFGPRHNASECQFLDHESRDDLSFVLGLKC